MTREELDARLARILADALVKSCRQEDVASAAAEIVGVMQKIADQAITEHYDLDHRTED